MKDKIERVFKENYKVDVNVNEEEYGSEFELNFDVYKLFEDVIDDKVFLKILRLIGLSDGSRVNCEELMGLIEFEELSFWVWVGLDMIESFKVIESLESDVYMKLKNEVLEYEVRLDNNEVDWEEVLNLVNERSEEFLGLLNFRRNVVKNEEGVERILRCIRNERLLRFVNDNCNEVYDLCKSDLKDKWLKKYTIIVEDDDNELNLELFKNDWMKNKYKG